MAWRHFSAVARDLDPDLAEAVLSIEDEVTANVRDAQRMAEDRDIGRALAALFEVCPPRLAQEVCVTVLDYLKPEGPIAHDNVMFCRENARWWAGAADSVELREHIAAGCRELAARAEVIAEGPRKALLVALWTSLPEGEKRKFIARVDPKGVFRGAA